MNAHNPPQMPLLDLDLLRTLIAIADSGNFSAAAEVVFRTPSAVSMQVKRIEEIIGRPIFRREARSVTLNPDGELLLGHARRVLALNRDMLAQFVEPDVSGIVRLGALDHAVDQFLPKVLCRFAESHPGIRVDVLVENSTEQIELFDREELDVAIVTSCVAQPSRASIEILLTEKLVWAGLKDGAAVQQSPLPVSVWEEGCVWRKFALEGLDANSLDYRVNFMSAHVAGQKAGILADLAVAPLPLSSCHGNVVPIDKKYGLPELPDYSLGILVDPKAPPQVQAVADTIRAAVSQSH